MHDADFYIQDAQLTFFCALKGGALEKLPGIANYTSSLYLPDGQGVSILHRVSEEPMVQEVAEYVLRSLKPNRIKPVLSLADKAGDTPAHYAARHGNEEWFSVLATQGAKLSLLNNKGESPLHLAIRYGHANLLRRWLPVLDWESMETVMPLAFALGESKCAEKVIPLLADVSGLLDRCDKHGRTVLMRKAAKGDEKTLVSLLDVGVDATIKDTSGKNALHHFSCRPARTDAFPVFPKFETARRLVAATGGTNELDALGNSALHLAAKHGREDVIVMLTAHGVKRTVASQKLTFQQTTPATEVNGENRAGRTPLMCAVAAKRRNIIKLLLAFHADSNRRSTVNGETALHTLAKQGSSAHLILLLEHGADPQIKDNKGRRPGDVARNSVSRAWLTCIDIPVEERCRSKGWLKTPKAWFILRNLRADEAQWSRLMSVIIDRFVRDAAIRREVLANPTLPDRIREILAINEC